jgi:myosin heavy subunit
LISVNPFKRLPLYTPTVMDQYMHKGTKEMPPHTYNIADDAYRAMIDNRMNQVRTPACLLATLPLAL